MRPITILLLLPWQLLVIVIAATGDETTTNNACIDNGLDVVDSRVSVDDHQLGTLANYSLTVAWDDSIAPSANRTVEYGTVRTITVDGDVPVGAAIVYSRRSESFRHAGSSTVVQRHDQVAPVTWTFDRVGLFAVTIYLVPDYETNRDNDECLFYANDVVYFHVFPKADMIEIAAKRYAHRNCNLCPDNELLSVSEVGFFVPEAGVEQTCAGWYQDSINGKLNAELCTVLRTIEAQGDTCKCDPASTAAPFAGRVLSRWLAAASAILTLTTMLSTASTLAL
jgi:hypothetical protein